MANLQNMLNAAKKQKASGGNAPAQRQPQQSNQNRMMESFSSKDTDLLDDMVFGAPTDDGMLLYEQYPNGEMREVYDPNKEMEELKSGRVNYQAANSHLPQVILESIMQNPLNVPMDGIEISDQVMSEGLQNRTLDIIDKLDSRDRKRAVQQPQAQPQPINEQQMYQQPRQVYAPAPQQMPQMQPSGYNFSLNELAGLIEAVVDKKFRQYGAGMLTEGKGGAQAPRVNLMTIGDSLKFMDSSGNVYECTMKYIGKGKVKNK
jgi:hypothetical protein